MQKFLAVVTSLCVIVTVVLGLLVYLGVENVVKYHLIAAILTLLMVLTITHQIFWQGKPRTARHLRNTDTDIDEGGV